MQRRRQEAELRLAAAKRKGNRIRPKHSRLSLLCSKCGRSKVVVLALNFVGAIGCILVNKYVMQKRDFELPLTLTLMGYAMVSLFIAFGKARKGELRWWNGAKAYLKSRRSRSAKSKSLQDDFLFFKTTVEDDPLLKAENGGGDTAALPTSLSSPGGGSLSKMIRWRRYALIVFTAVSPALANFSLNVNSVGFTQLSKVLTTPCIASLERMRGIGLPLTWSRLFWLGVVHVGVFLASVADVAVSSKGVAVALANVVVTARYKVEWSAASRERVKVHALGGKPTAAHEVAAVDEVVESTLPPATLVLLPLAFFIEGPSAFRAFSNMDAQGFATLAMAAFFGAWTSFTGYAVIGRLSALTHQILGQAKMAILVLSSKFILGAQLNSMQLAGAALTMIAIIAYTHQTIDQSRRIDQQGDNADKSSSRSSKSAFHITDQQDGNNNGLKWTASLPSPHFIKAAGFFGDAPPRTPTDSPVRVRRTVSRGVSEPDPRCANGDHYHHHNGDNNNDGGGDNTTSPPPPMATTTRTSSLISGAGDNHR